MYILVSGMYRICGHREIRTNHSPVGRGDDLLGARWKSDAGGLGLVVMRDDGGVVSRCAGDSSAIPGLLLKTADNGTLRHGAYWQDVANCEEG